MAKSDGPGDALAIDLRNVTKIYQGGGMAALRGIEMRVRRGEVFGLLGPNGAGKSTLVKIMMTVVRPTRMASLTRSGSTRRPSRLRTCIA